MKGVTASSILSAETRLEPGDRFAIPLSSEVRSSGRVPIPESIRASGLVIDEVEDHNALMLKSSINAAEICLTEDETARPILEQSAAAWLEYRGPGRFRLVVEETAAGPSNGEVTTEQGVRVAFDPQDWAIVRGGLQPANLPEFDLALRAARLATHAGFDRLICLPLVRDMELLEHQIRTAKTVLRRFRGRALLCDEVGLGKTIEAGLVLDELHLRGLARSTLVLVPPSLIEQWQGEMRRKFGLDFTSHDDPAFRQRGSAAWNEFDHVIASLHTAKREPHRSAILGRKWDMVIVDEAHHLRNRNTQLLKFASE